MNWVFIIGLKAPDGSVEQREFVVRDERLANILRRVIFDKSATREEMEAFAAETAKDPALNSEWLEVQQYLKAGWTLQ